ncbi:MAG TPA: OFA family MFS transporter [Vicinamibacterales bacterium]|nr:OFA family MFS transporter [Vicinamibacterales bacterium]
MVSASPNRWRIPVGAVLVHVCIGSVYAWSTFNRPIQQIFPDAPAWFSPPYTTFTTALTLLGLSAAFGGPWVERRGPRVAAVVAALFFGIGLAIGGVGLAIHQSVLVFLGMGVVGGIGAGIGYIAPVSTLVKWFPDRRGMATGMAIMGFGGGAFVAGYLNQYLIDHVGIATGVMLLGGAYLIVMLLGAWFLESPPVGWRPAGWSGRMKTGALIAERSVSRNHALATFQFYLLWAILFINVTAGIGILAQASPMTQDMFKRTPLQAAAVVSLISIFNAGGRFVWASASDYIGRRNTYTLFFVVQVVLFLLIPGFAARGAWVPFELSLFVVFTMYGGGFSTIPAFLADIFGPENVGAIHGAVLTAWSAAAIVGPVIITALSTRAKALLPPGGDRVHIYDTPLQVLAAMLAVGFVLTLLVRPLRHPDGTPAAESVAA